jgi:predicted porin
MINQGKRKDKSTTDSATAFSNRDQKILGLGVDYKLSKRTALWARYENKDPDTNRSGTSTLTTTSSNDATKTTAIGIRHTF